MKEKNKMKQKLNIFLSCVAVMKISVIGTFLLRVEQAEKSEIMLPEENYELEGVKVETDKSVRININTASKSELMLLNGIGEAKADAIISYRETTPFRTTKDIMNVSGIGEKIYQENADIICIE